jgi:uncharacterized protein (TIGR04255 family)
MTSAMPYKHYERAPVFEAVIDLHVRYADPPRNEWFSSCHEKLAAKFPTQNPIAEMQFGMLQDPETQAVQTQFGQQSVGLRLTSESGNRVLQIQRRGFTYSHLAPYSRWESFRQEAEEHWKTFIEVCKVTEVTRVAVRYINRIVIPAASIELYDYFSLYPKIPQGIPQDVNGYSLQLRMPQNDLGTGAIAILSMGMEGPGGGNEIPILLDIDVSRLASWRPIGSDVWDFIERLRDRKNLIFEACITNKTRELFQ